MEEIVPASVSSRLDALDETSRDLVHTVLHGEEWGYLEAPPDDSPTISGELIGRLLRGEFGAIDGTRVRIRGAVITGDVDLSYLDLKGELDLRYSDLQGTLYLDHTSLTGSLELGHCTVHRIHATRAVIDGALRFSDGTCHAGIYANGIRITGPLVLRRTTVTAPPDHENQCALELFRAQVADIFLMGSTLHGGLYANAATVAQHIRLRGATITSRESLGWPTGPDSQAGAVSLSGATLGGNLYLTDANADAEKPEIELRGALVLSNTSCNTLRCRTEVLRRLAPAVDHFTFKRLVGIEPSEWLTLLNESGKFSTHSYVHYTRYCDELGRADLARVGNIALQDRITAELPRWSGEWLARKFWGWSVAYGYRPGRTLFWLLACVVVSWLCLALGGDFLVHVTSHRITRGTGGWDQSLALAIDQLLPFAGLGAADGWHADATSPMQAVFLTIFTLLKFLAWGSAAAGLASMTGVMKRG